MSIAATILSTDTTVYSETSQRGRYVVGGLGTVTIAETLREDSRGMRVADHFAAMHAAAETIGSWTSDGLIYLDAGDTWDDLTDALKVAAERAEQAIFDTIAKVVIMVTD